MRAQLEKKIREKDDRIQGALHRIRLEQARRAVHQIRCVSCAEDDVRCVWEVLDDDSNTPCMRCRMQKTECTLIPAAPDSAGPSLSEEDEDMEEEDDAWRKLSGPDEIGRAHV